MKKLTQAEYLPIEKLKPFEWHPFYVRTMTTWNS